MMRSGALAAAVFGALAGCQTASLEEVAPVSAMTAPAPLPPPAPSESAEAPVATAAPAAAPVTAMQASVQPTEPPPGDYPNLNVPMQSAAPTLTEAETLEGTARLQAARRANASAPRAPRDAPSPGDMRRLARDRLQETLRRIEAE